MHSKTWLKPRGVTLVELMVVIALIGVLAAVGGPSVFRSVERMNSGGVARTVASTYSFARNQAMSRGEPVWVTITPGVSVANRGSIVVQRQFDVTKPAPRTCREFDAMLLQDVRTFTMDGQSGRQMLTGRAPAARMCFGPDGRALGETGRPLATDATNCLGDAYGVWLADVGATISGSMKNCASNATNRLTQVEEREAVHFYRIAVPFHGNVRID